MIKMFVFTLANSEEVPQRFDSLLLLRFKNNNIL